MACVQLLKEELRLVNWRLRHHEPHRFVNSQWEKLHALVYVVYRCVLAGYLLAVSIVSGLRTTSAPHYFIYLTHWTLLLLTFSHVVRALTTFYCFITGKHSPQVAADNDVDFTNFAVHGSNSIIVLTDIFVTSVPVRVFHAHHPVVYSLLYSLFSGIYYAAGGKTQDGGSAIYPVLDYSKNPGVAVGLLLGVSFLLIPVLHIFLYGLHLLRLFLHRKCAGESKSISGGGNAVGAAVENAGFSEDNPV